MRWLLLLAPLLLVGCSIPVRTNPDTDVYLFHGLGWPGCLSDTSKIKYDLNEVNLKVAELHHFQFPMIESSAILIGKSLGADAALKVAWDLHERHISVELLILIDPFSCRAVPPNVKRSVCIRSWPFTVACDAEYIVKAPHLVIGGVPQVRQIVLDEITSISDKSRPRLFSSA